MRLLLLTSLALFVAAPAQAVAAHVRHSTGTPVGQGALDVAVAGVSVVAGLGQAPRAAEPGVGLSFGDSAMPSSPADGHLLGNGSWASWSGSASDPRNDQRADVPQNSQHNPALHMAGYGSAMAEPAGWAVAAAAVLTLLGLLGLRSRAH